MELNFIYDSIRTPEESIESLRAESYKKTPEAVAIVREEKGIRVSERPSSRLSIKTTLIDATGRIPQAGLKFELMKTEDGEELFAYGTKNIGSEELRTVTPIIGPQKLSTVTPIIGPVTEAEFATLQRFLDQQKS